MLYVSIIIFELRFITCIVITHKKNYIFFKLQKHEIMCMLL